MAFVRTGDILRRAYREGYGVAAFNVFNYETIQLAIWEAQVLEKPVIVAFYPGFQGHISYRVVADVTRELAAVAKVPVGLHLDHCSDLHSIFEAMGAGFDSVMYDGSRLPFEENVRNTRFIVEAAEKRGIDVEAELGAVGNADNAADFADAAKYTTVEEAVTFVQQTGCHSLAVAVGNAHGHYVQEPHLDLPRIAAISKAVGIPLVLHGGSGIPDEQVAAAIQQGIAKINVATEYHQAYYEAVEQYMKTENNRSMYGAVRGAGPAVRAFLAHKINNEKNGIVRSGVMGYGPSGYINDINRHLRNMGYSEI